MAEIMENNNNTQARSHFYQKDYSKLEVIFEKAVERSRQKKIIHYASDRLYSKDDRRKMAQESFKSVYGAEPLLEQDIQTEIRDLEPSSEEISEEVDEDRLFSFFSSTPSLDQEDTITSADALQAYEALVDASAPELESEVSEIDGIEVDQVPVQKDFDAFVESAENLTQDEIPIFTLPFEEETIERTEPLEEPPTEELAEEDITAPSQPQEADVEENVKFEEIGLDETLPENITEDDIFLNFDSLAERMPEELAKEPVYETETFEEVPENRPSETSPIGINPETAREFFEDEEEEPEDVIAANESIEEVRKDVSISRIALIAAAIFLGIYVIVFFAGFMGFDYIALVLTLIGFSLGFVMQPRGLIGTCLAMIVVLIGCMIYTISRTSEGIVFYHYLWFLFIPISMSTSFAFINSRRKLQALENEEREEDRGYIYIEEIPDYSETQESDEDTEELLVNRTESESVTRKSNETQEAVYIRRHEPEVEVRVSLEPELKVHVKDKSELKEAEEHEQIDFDGDADFYDLSIFEDEAEEEEESEPIELSDTYNNSFDWNNALDESERNNNVSVIAEMGEETLLSEFVENAQNSENLDTIDLFAEEDNGGEDAKLLADILASLEGQDEESISVEDDQDDIIWNISEE